MAKIKYASLKTGFVLFTLIFAITFVSLFTYLPIYSKTMEQTEQNLREDLKLQSAILSQILQPVVRAKSKRRYQQESEKALTQIQSLWQNLDLQENGKTLFLTRKNPQNNKTEILTTSGDVPLDMQTSYLLSASLYQDQENFNGLHIFRSKSRETVFTVYASLIPDKWGLVIQKKTSLINETFYETLSYTLFAALLVTLTSWLVLRIKTRALEQQEESLEKRYQSLLASTHDWIWETDRKGYFIYSNEQADELLGFYVSELSNININDLFDESIANNSKLIWKQKQMLGDTFNNLEVAFRDKKGRTVFLLLSGYPLFNSEHELEGFRGIARNITDLKTRDQKNLSQERHDPLTGLINRQYFIDQLSKHLDRFKIDKICKPSALLSVDLDNFKAINETFGHKTGDILLKELAKRMQSFESKTNLISRFDGDGFAILVKTEENLSSKAFIEQLERFLKRFIDRLNEPFQSERKAVHIGASIGVALIPQDGKTVTEILHHADAAMYHAKTRGKNTYEFYDIQTQKQVDKKIKTSGELENAIQNNEFELHYQLQFQDKKVTGMEALLRWHHPESRKVLSAGEFINDLKDIQQSQLVDEWVINQVAKDIALIKNNLTQSIPVSINLSTQEIFKSSLPNIVEAVIKKNFISGHAFNIEASENILAENFSETSKTIKRLNKLGVNTCIDHFGTGYLSLANLQALPIEAIKIDKSFIDNVATSHSDLQMCRSIIQLAKSMQLKVIAEGIETTIQKDILNREGCDIMQGYIFAQPMPLQKILNYLNDHPQLLN